MLVLTRKTDEEILIGEDIKIKLVRVRGNSVRLGIDAPRDVRIVRGELDRHDDKPDANTGSQIEIDLDDSDQVFAHPQATVGKQSSGDPAENRLRHLMDEVEGMPTPTTNHSIFVGRVHRPESSEQSSNAPFARYMVPR